MAWQRIFWWIILLYKKFYNYSVQGTRDALDSIPEYSFNFVVSKTKTRVDIIQYVMACKSIKLANWFADFFQSIYTNFNALPFFLYPTLQMT